VQKEVRHTTCTSRGMYWQWKGVGMSVAGFEECTVQQEIKVGHLIS